MNNRTLQEAHPHHVLGVALGALALLALGAVFTYWSAWRQDRWMREDLLSQARLFVQTINRSNLRQLDGNPTDEQKPEYRRLKEQLMAAQQINPDWQWIYLMGRTTNRTVFFQLDSEDYNAPDPSPPGQTYEEATAVLQSVFDEGRSITEGPVPDRWGIWVSAFVPVKDLQTGDLISVLGIDIEASHWAQMRARAAIPPLLATLALLALWIGGNFLMSRRAHPDACKTRFCRYLESILAAATGLVLTATAVWLVRQSEVRSETVAFRRLADIESMPVCNIAKELRDLEMNGFASFFESSEDVTDQEFRQYASHLANISEVTFWGWADVVAASNRVTYEADLASRSGHPDLTLWEPDAAGTPVPASLRDIYFPLVHLAPLKALERMRGIDLGADPVRRAELQKAMQTRLTTAIGPIPALQTALQSPGLLLVRPSSRGGHSRTLNGLVFASLDLYRWLHASLNQNPDRSPMAAIDLFELAQGTSPVWIGSTAEHSGMEPASSLAVLPRLTMIRPLLAFGHTYAVVARPTPAFFQLQESVAWLLALAGLVLTGSIAWMLGFFANRREDLARLVEEQRHKLGESAHHYSLLAQHSRVITWELDIHGIYVDISSTAETILGYRPDEIIGKKHFYDLCPESQREEFQREGLRLLRLGEPVTDVVNAMVAKSGQIVWVSSSGIPIRDAQGQLTGYWGTDTDITDRKLAEESLAKMARENQVAAERYAALIRASNTGAWEYDRETRRVWCSPEYFTLLGYDPAEFNLPPDERTVENLWLNLIHPGDRTASRDYLAAYLEHPAGMFDLRFRMRRKDGSWAWIWSRGQILAGPGGQPTPMLVGTHIDVTESMRAEENVRTSEQKYRMLTESMKDVVWIVEVDSLRFLYVSPSVERLRGFTPEEVMAGTIETTVMPEQAGRLRDMIRQHAEEFRQGQIGADTFFTLELQQPCRNGGHVVTEAVVRFWPNQRTGQLELHGVSRDITDRKRAEENYRTLFQNMFEGFALHEILVDARGRPMDYRFLAVNPAFERMTGLKAGQLVGKTLREALPEAETKWIEIYGNVAQTGIPLFFDNYSAEMKRHFEVTVFRPAPGQFACIFNDITERKLAEYDLRESRRQYASLMANLPGMAYRCQNNRQWTMNFVSQGAVDLTGYAPEDLVNNQTLSYSDLIHPDYRNKVWNDWQAALQAHRQYEGEYQIITRAGEIKWVWERGEGIYDDDNTVAMLEGFVADITERKRAEREREQLIRAIEQSGETILITDSAGLILYVNPAFTRVSGFTREEAIGQTPRLLSSGKHDPAFYRAMWQTLNAGQTWEGQIINKRKDGTLFTEQAAISPVRDAAGQIVNFVAVKRDITGQLRAEEEKEALQAQLTHAQKLESVGRLAGGVAHDFNNMLQAILGYVEMALEQVPPGQPLHADLQEIQKAATRSTSLTRQLQTFARRQIATPKLLDLNEAVEGMFAMLRRLIGEDIQLVWKPGPDIGLVKIDPSQLDQVVANLCINARDAIGKSGHITLETCRVDAPATDATVPGDLASGTYALLSVRDDGCGMKPDVLEHIFEPFFTTKPVGKGTGLGLSTVYGIVKQNGGSIHVDSQQNRGSIFRIFLPRFERKTAEAAGPVAGPEEPVALSHETILLVEDEETILRTTRRILETLGYTVLATNSPQDALRICKERHGRIDLLLTDVIMPGMNGPELIRHVTETYPGIRHLFMSGYTANLLAEQGVRENNIDFIQKPFTRKLLAQKVRESIARK